MPDAMRKWLQPQNWQRDSDDPCVSLGAPGAFDDMHLFAPCVAFENNTYSMWYCGSRGDVDDRVFHMGLATGRDGVHFAKHPQSPVYSFGDGVHSVLTPTLLRSPDGALLRENGALRMWFAATTFEPGNPHTLHETASEDGIRWAPPSATQLSEVYAPTVIKEEDAYRMWYTDVTRDPWCYRHAESPEGQTWQVTPNPVLQLDQAWEHGRLFYPTVLKADGLYLMWYGSYLASDHHKTAIGLAVSKDGVHWRKNPNNPVFGPDESRAWESHYTTSQSVFHLPDGTWRIWYASRTRPPFTHKYFAIGTARWAGPE